MRMHPLAPRSEECQLIEAALTACFDGEGTPEESRLVRRHLHGCKACRAMWRDWTRQQKLFRSWTAPRLPSTLLQRILVSCRWQGWTDLSDFRSRFSTNSAPHAAKSANPLAPPVPEFLQDAILARTTGTARRLPPAAPAPRPSWWRAASALAVPALLLVALLNLPAPETVRMESSAAPRLVATLPGDILATPTRHSVLSVRNWANRLNIPAAYRSAGAAAPASAVAEETTATTNSAAVPAPVIPAVEVAAEPAGVPVLPPLLPAANPTTPQVATVSYRVAARQAPPTVSRPRVALLKTSLTPSISQRDWVRVGSSRIAGTGERRTRVSLPPHEVRVMRAEIPPADFSEYEATLAEYDPLGDERPEDARSVVDAFRAGLLADLSGEDSGDDGTES